MNTTRLLLYDLLVFVFIRLNPSAIVILTVRSSCSSSLLAPKSPHVVHVLTRRSRPVVASPMLLFQPFFVPLLHLTSSPPPFALSGANSTSIHGRVRSSRHPSVLSFTSIVVIRHHRPSHTRVDILINISDHRDYSSLPVTLLSSCRHRSSSS